METLTLAQARRVALAAQGLARPRRFDGTDARMPTLRQVTGTVGQLGLVQIDSVNVLARAHLVPLYSRLGPYDTGLLDRAAGRSPRRVVEAWAHQASYIPAATYPLLEWRRRAAAAEAWGSISSVAQTHADVLAEVRRVVADQGPITSAQMQRLFEDAHPRTRSTWGWNWSVAKRALEYLFFTGEVAAASRTASFERSYDLTDRVLPPAVRALPPVADDDAVRALLAIGARAHGVGTLRCFRDYFRLRGPAVRRALADLVDAGTLRPVSVRGWDEPTFLHADAAIPRRATATTLLSPFDPLVFERTRVERLFGVRYRIEIYVPAAQRVHGYYVLPFLQDDAIAARLDLKADRRAGVLRVVAAWAEVGATAETPERLAAELETMASWLGLGRIEAGGGDLGPTLAARLC